MGKIFHLSTCNTCKRIIDNLPENDFELQNIKENPINEKELDLLAKEHGSYEALFNKRAIKYRSLKESIVSEEDLKKAILSEYTFLKRPVILLEKESFVGNAKKTIEAAHEAILKN